MVWNLILPDRPSNCRRMGVVVSSFFSAIKWYWMVLCWGILFWDWNNVLFLGRFQFSEGLNIGIQAVVCDISQHSHTCNIWFHNPNPTGLEDLDPALQSAGLVSWFHPDGCSGFFFGMTTMTTPLNQPGFYNLPVLQMSIWRFLEIGLPLVIIHFERWDFP